MSISIEWVAGHFYGSREGQFRSIPQPATRILHLAGCGMWDVELLGFHTFPCSCINTMYTVTGGLQDGAGIDGHLTWVARQFDFCVLV